MKKAVLALLCLFATLGGRSVGLAEKYAYVAIRSVGYTGEEKSYTDGVHLLHSSAHVIGDDLIQQQAAAWAWGGLEPGAEAEVSATGDSDDIEEWGYLCEAKASGEFWTKVRYRTGAVLDPAPLVVPVTLRESLTATASASGGSASAYAKVQLTGEGVNYFHSKSYDSEYGPRETRSGSASFSVLVNAALRAEVSASVSARVPYQDSSGASGAYANADPILVIDPDYEYADYFEVWVDSVTIPEPSAFTLLGMSTSVVFVFTWRRRRTA